MYGSGEDESGSQTSFFFVLMADGIRDAIKTKKTGLTNRHSISYKRTHNTQVTHWLIPTAIILHSGLREECTIVIDQSKTFTKEEFKTMKEELKTMVMMKPKHKSSASPTWGRLGH